MPEARRKSYETYLKGSFPAAVIAEVGLDRAALSKWFDANAEFIYSPKRYKLAIDEDLQQLGLSNRKPEFFDWLTDRLTADANDELALRLVKRYLGETGPAATTLLWIRKHRGNAFFSDQGGFRWFAGPAADEAAASDASAQRHQRER